MVNRTTNFRSRLLLHNQNTANPFAQYSMVGGCLVAAPRWTHTGHLRPDRHPTIPDLPHYTEYAGCAITAGIPVKFGTAHGRSRPDVGSAKRIDVYGSGGVSRPSRIPGESDHNIISLTHLVRPKRNFYSLTICNLDQYLPNGSGKSVQDSPPLIDSNAAPYYQFPFVIRAARSKYGKSVCAVYTHC